ncbi:MAG: 50S ribosomal protein L9 [Oligoflexia bacterium]
MQVILRENVANLGRIGDIVKVSDGYARNFLLPRNLVFIADESNVRVIEHHKRALEKKRQSMKASAQALVEKMAGLTLTIARKVGEHDKLFGSVSSGDMVEALAKAGFEIERRSIQMTEAIKTLGAHTVTVRLLPEVSATVKVLVTKES